MKNAIYLIVLAIAIPLVIKSFAISEAREAEARQLEHIDNAYAVSRTEAEAAGELDQWKRDMLAEDVKLGIPAEHSVYAERTEEERIQMTAWMEKKEADREAESLRKQQEVVDSAEYWRDPGRHFKWSDLEFGPTAVQGVLTFNGRLKNVGERDARYVALKVSLRNAQKREVGRGNVQKHDGLKSGGSWWFDGILTVREPGAVEAFIAEESFVAFGYQP